MSGPIGDSRGKVSSPSGKSSWRDPRRSLVARLLWIIVPAAVLPPLAFRVVSARSAQTAERELKAADVDRAAARERIALGEAADRRAAELDRLGADVLAVLHEAAAAAGTALEAGPSPALSVEPLVDVPGRPLHTADRAGSAAFVTRQPGLTPLTRRDLAATRRLEEPYERLVSRHPHVSAIFVHTASGVLRAVPWCDLSRLIEAGEASPTFRLSPRWSGLERSRAGRGGPAPVVVTPVYDDLYAHRGRIVSALTPVFSARDELLAEVGVDWALEELFGASGGTLRAGEVEVVFSKEGRTVFRTPGGEAGGTGLPPLPDARLFALAGAADTPLVERRIGEETVILVSRALKGLPWTYVRGLPAGAVRNEVEREVEAVFRSLGAQRRRTLNAFLAASLAVAAALALAVHRVTAPVREVARAADELLRGGPARKPEPGDRRDELGRLAAGMQNLKERIGRRTRFFEGMQELTRGASVVTGSDELVSRLCRQVAGLAGAGRCVMALWDPAARALVFRPSGDGVPEDRLAGARVGPEEMSLTALAYRTGETYVSHDLANDPRASAHLHGLAQRPENAVFVPLRTDVGVLGVLVVLDKADGFDEEEIASVQGYADQAALLLRNARLYEELQRSYERLRDATRNRDYFLQNMNHELRTPLTAILGWSEVLAEDRPDAETLATAVEQIRRSADFLLALVSDLLDLSRLEEGGTKLEPKDVDLATLVKDAIEPVAVMAEGKGIAVGVEIPAAGAAIVRLDPVRIKQVLWNLVHNAVKFTPRGGRIEVAARAGVAGTEITVSDDGVGIDPKDLPYIFERFRQGDGSTTRSYRGTGIGLALTKALVELHGGTIDAGNRPGRGSLFRVFIPQGGPPGSPAA